MEKGIIFDIEHGSFVDGPGIRTTVFLKGCNLRCAWCHNPESQSGKTQLLYYRDKCTGCGRCRDICENAQCVLCGKCALYCPAGARELCGREVTVGEIMDEVMQDAEFYVNCGGLTVSGGECMLQPEFLTQLLKAAGEQGIHRAVDTAGNVPWEVFERILPHTDLFLYDVKSMDSGKHREFTGVGNERILANLSKLLQLGAKLWIRVPVIPGVNDTTAEMTALRSFLRENGRPERVELLPYHTMGENKFRALNREPRTFQIPDGEHMNYLRSLFVDLELI